MPSLTDDIVTYLKSPAIGLRGVRIASGARSLVAEVLDGLPHSGHVAVLMDDADYRTAGGEDVKRDVTASIRTGRTVVPVVLTGDVHADEATVALATAGCSGADVVVTIGSGTLSDIGKVAAGARPHIVVQTAASVNGFADDESALLINGAKRTTHSAWPHTLLVDIDVLCGAPVKLNRSGLGDMISMFTAPADWYLASLLGTDDGFDDSAAAMTRQYGDRLLEIAGGIGRSEPAALTSLAEFVTLSGLSMGVAGRTSPSSGMEHTVSHLLDMANGAAGRPLAHHGEQVGVATVLASLLWRRMARLLADGGIGDIRLPSPDEAEKAVRNAFGWMDPDGATAGECWSDYRKKLARLDRVGAASRLATAVRSWPVHARVLDTMLAAPERIVGALRDAGAPIRCSELSEPIPTETLVWATTNCHLMRNRFTVADLAWLTGNWSAADVASLMAEADELAAGA